MKIEDIGDPALRAEVTRNDDQAWERVKKLTSWIGEHQWAVAGVMVLNPVAVAQDQYALVHAALRAALLSPEWARAILAESERGERANRLALTPEEVAERMTLDEAAHALIAAWPVQITHTEEVDLAQLS